MATGEMESRHILTFVSKHQASCKGETKFKCTCIYLYVHKIPCVSVIYMENDVLQSHLFKLYMK